MKTKRIVLLLAVLVVFAVAMTSCAFLSQYHEHVWEGGSCTEPRVCSVCHAVDEKALGHAEETVTGYAATCTEDGLSDGTVCSICNTVVVAQEVIPALGHDIVVDAAIDADCLNSGLTAGEHCSRCDHKVDQEEVPALGHDIVKDAAKAPTCTEAGLTAGEHCTKCDYNSAQEVVPALGHDMVVDAAKAPTCTEAGLKEGSHCSRCDHKVAQEVDPALGHNIVKDEAKAPTCTETGLTEGEHCTVCDYKVEQKVVAATGHSYENCACTVCQAVLPALGVTDSFDFSTQAGFDSAVASGKLGFVGNFRNNGDSFQFNADSTIQFVAPANSTITVTGHSAQYGVFNVSLNGEVTKMAGTLTFTVTEETKVVISVSDNGASYSYIKGIALEAYVDRTITEDTTINFGSEGNYKDSIVDFSGIQIGDNGGNNSQVKNGSFDLLLKAGSKVVIHGYPGYTSYKLNDGEEITAEWYTYIALTDTVLTVTPVNGSNYFYSIEITLHEGIELVAAKDSTCSVAGHEEYYTCSCHGELTEKVARELLAHTEETVVGKAATCTETGLTNGKKCSACGAILEAQQLIPAAGHKDDNNDYKCDVCEADLCTEHVAGEAVEENRTEATCTAAGSYDSVVKCQHCHEELSRETISIPILPHTEVKDAAVDPTCTKAGLTEGKHCSVCGTVTEAQVEIPENGHTEQTLAGKDATCTEAGLTEGKKCSVCGETLEAQVEIPAKGHAYETIYVWAADNSYYTEKQVCKNDASHVVEGETATVSHITLNVTASKVTFTYHAGEQTKVVESDLALENNIATIDAPAVEGRVASHDYVKFSFHEASTHEFTIYYSELSVWDGVSVSESLQGSGTAEDPYLIQSGADLAYIAQVVNALEVKTGTFKGEYFVLTNSIDLNGHELHIGSGSGYNNRQYFGGHLDGNNCTIRGINNRLSLIGCLEGGSAKNLSLYGEVNVAQGNDSVGVFVGYLRTTLTNITNYATMNGRGNVGGIVGNMEQAAGITSSNLVNYGTITAVQNVGGIAGLIGKNLSNCTNWGIINGNNNVGGIVGNLYWACTISNSVNYGTVSGKVDVGGIAGVRNGTIAATLVNCVNYANVCGTTCTSTGIDGITAAESTKTDCVNNGSVAIAEHQLTHTDAKAATCEADGNVAYDYCSVCKKNYDADGKAIANVVISALGHAWDDGVTADGKITYTCANCGGTRVEDAKATITVNHLNLDGSVAAEAESLEFDYDTIATINAKTIEGYVASHDYVKVHVQGSSSVTIYYSEVSVWDGTSVSESLSGTGTAADPYLIQSAADFAYFAAQVNANTAASGSNYKVTTFKGQYFKMTKSIDLNGHYLIVGMHVGWNNYQGFFGHFDGNNCSIRGINIDNSTGSTSTALFGCINAGSLKNLTAYGELKGNSIVGGLVAYTVTNAVVENVTSYINVTSMVANGRQGTVGGIVANQENSAGALLNCVNYGTVTCDSYIVGGIVGSGGKDITGCVNWGVVTGGNVSVGGISGSTKDKGTISGCVNYGTVTGATTAYGQIGGIVGTAKKPISDCANYGTVIGTTSKGVGQIYGTTTTTVSNCIENGEVKEYVAE